MQDLGDACSISESDDPMEKRVATYSGRIPWTEETGGLQSMGSQRVGSVLGTQHEHKKGRKEGCKGRREGGRRARKELCHMHRAGCEWRKIHQSLSLSYQNERERGREREQHHSLAKSNPHTGATHWKYHCASLVSPQPPPSLHHMPPFP